MSKPLEVVFVGLGYIGLPTAVVMANHGVRVHGVDVNAAAVERIQRGEVTIVEPGLEDQLKKAVDSGQLTATTEMQHGDAFVIAVPTPFKENYEGDLSYIMSAAESIAPQLSGGETVILESTSPPRTTQKLAAKIMELRPDLSLDGEDGKPVVYFAYCPERILPGKALEELISNDRIIGGSTPEAARRARAVYASFCEGELLKTDDVTAEMSKLTENSFRDVNIAFANELSLIADKLGIDVWELIELANHHPRVNILQPGPGVGGHCIAVDPWFIVAADRENSNLIRTAREVNDGKPKWVISKVEEACSHVESPVIAALGLAFKANIDDLRESPAMNITRDLAEHVNHATVLAVEPNVSELPKGLQGLPNVEFAEYKDAIDRADVVLLLVDHDEFKALPATALKGKALVDTKGLWR
ncbi:UDP-N-acetyl-D-mannosamine dehydrogenase [Kocuria rhizophila]|uniref:UDP-N-acetyl-D-mannosamine dehydrogenase n=3 Tax=Kocuria rhizophila TaxID=72000 RepID=A0AAX2SFK2_KOCRH|nr:UDP-N-acetyl-D-mannosamine dehydrogenase [Kocuria rhizophila]MBO4144483.1 UDP-N-acetyl-D-mannosamine dehydrogenase [Kocuria rhizophila]PKZ39116.1 UDP-N-acetyl-D-mannosamine dehydrogenase [Kocuria rhizophila]QTK30607.1 UDP-N-acetyl-D-mannosamine dehydrogenase [Kocuria rhizophila]TFI02646.1 UDP-N-acetyl-D-mannosamine dehydrogenase [Kocuria rhizophila]